MSYNLNIYCKSYLIDKIPYKRLTEKGLQKNIINKTSWLNLRCCIFTFDSILEDSYTKNIYSRVLQSLLIQQIKLSKGILKLTGIHSLTGQETLSRSIYEIYVTIGWLLNDTSGKRFHNFIYNGLSTAGNSIKHMKRDIKNSGKVSPIQKGIIIDSIKEFKRMNFSNNSINSYLKLTDSKINKRYHVPGIKKRTESVDSSGGIYNIYKALCAGVHSSVSEIVKRNTIKKNNIYKSNMLTKQLSSDPRIMDALSFFILKTFKLVYRRNIFTTNNLVSKLIERKIILFMKNYLIIEHADEELIDRP